jgi:hypothetical protein
LASTKHLGLGFGIIRHSLQREFIIDTSICLVERMMLKSGPDQYGQRVSRKNEEYYTNSQSNAEKFDYGK